MKDGAAARIVFDLIFLALLSILVGVPLAGLALILRPAVPLFPLWSVPLSAWWLKERITARRILGVGLGMGAMLLLMSNEMQAVQAAPRGTLLIMGGAFSWAIGTVMMKRYPVDLPVTALAAWQLLLGGIPIYAGALAFEMHRLQPVTLWPAVALIYNVLVSFIFCHWAWFKIVTSVPVGVSSLSTLMIPVVGVFSGMLVLSERPHWQDFAALGLVLLALATVILPPGSIRSLFSKR